MEAESPRAAYDIDARFVVRSPQLIHRVIDDETVMIDLETGNYYTLLGSATVMWACIGAGKSVRETIDHLRRCYEGDPQAMEQALRRLLDQLMEEGAIVTSSDVIAKDGVPAPTEGVRPSFTDPVFEKYDDMADLILLDPVHEIDQEEGWPKRAPEA